jgi:restriction system protein
MAKSIQPQFMRFFIPIVQTLKELGGSGNAGEVVDIAIEKLKIPEDEQQISLKNGESKVRNQAQWARLYLVKGGFLKTSQRGIWTLTEKAQSEELTKDKVIEIIRDERKKFREQSKANKKAESTATIAEDETDIEEEEVNQSLLDIFQNLPAEGFERLCQRLLREAGFQEVRVTGKTGDGGIDGYGILEVNPLVSFNVLFQCKRYKGSVSASQIRDFRGAMQGRADKGIILTTGSFTSEAKKEARRDGAPPIEIVDGEKLVDMFEKLELGVIAKTVYEVDEQFFNEYKKTT